MRRHDGTEFRNAGREVFLANYGILRGIRVIPNENVIGRLSSTAPYLQSERDAEIQATAQSIIKIILLLKQNLNPTKDSSDITIQGSEALGLSTDSWKQIILLFQEIIATTKTDYVKKVLRTVMRNFHEAKFVSGGTGRVSRLEIALLFHNFLSEFYAEDKIPENSNLEILFRVLPKDTKHREDILAYMTLFLFQSQEEFIEKLINESGSVRLQKRLAEQNDSEDELVINILPDTAINPAVPVISDNSHTRTIPVLEQPEEQRNPTRQQLLLEQRYYTLLSEINVDITIATEAQQRGLHEIIVELLTKNPEYVNNNNTIMGDMLSDLVNKSKYVLIRVGAKKTQAIFEIIKKTGSFSSDFARKVIEYRLENKRTRVELTAYINFLKQQYSLGVIEPSIVVELFVELGNESLFSFTKRNQIEFDAFHAFLQQFQISPQSELVKRRLQMPLYKRTSEREREYYYFLLEKYSEDESLRVEARLLLLELSNTGSNSNWKRAASKAYEFISFINEKGISVDENPFVADRLKIQVHSQYSVEKQIEYITKLRELFLADGIERQVLIDLLKELSVSSSSQKIQQSCTEHLDRLGVKIQ